MKPIPISYLQIAALTVALFFAPGCTSVGKTMNQSIAMIALNSIQPFVSEGFAKKVALLVLDDRYPKDFFLPQEGGTVISDGEVWRVTFKNALLENNSDTFPIVNGVLLPRALTFTIRKTDAAILDIT